ncbi:preprotein translocase subunit SecA [Anaeropeptidivorans aminofermentans]|uniref:preprotein translocase subunit SecA n=1 Tax=Anaeropeptidivorans aminofermentans TaxID=2934315 RepID=UPI0020257DC0|nr:preprotein translocase subunit SecA [Anaeropeptidivorans aminofermentans]
MGIIQKIFGSYSDREIKRIKSTAEKVEKLEPSMEALSDDELRAKTDEFKLRLSQGETLDDLLPEAFAVVREASKRVLGMRHFHVQILGGIILHMGRISEMKTGEGKTLVSTLPAYLNALEGKGVHIVTVNDYLAKRDSEWMGKVHEFLGLKVGVILHDLTNEERRAAYGCDITYATNNELGFDYLRDNMVVFEKDLVQRELHYAIIDEVDSVLIDEARTPLIISGSSGKSTQLYKVADAFVKGLKKGRILNEDEALNPITRADIQEEGDFVVDEKGKTVTLTQEGIAKAERYFAIENLSDPENLEIQHHINNGLKANYNMHRDKDYVVQDDEIIIVDEFTGRLMPGRRYSDGLHQAIEAKENVKVNRESKTLATITFQNFFNKYTKKSGMTGTAMTEEGEFREIYGMDVVEIPTNMPMIRKDLSDLVYGTEKAKFRAVVKEIAASYEKGQPVLIGTITIEKSEELSDLLKKEGVPHQVLNAKYHEKEAEIVALAGQKNAVTIATNMAGRGTDIKLGEGVKELGGLKIIGTERHESRRIDNQLRGRSGRQGDPGESRFYISLEDDLMRLFGSDKIKNMFSYAMEEDEPIEHNILSKAIENAQKKVEGNNFSVRKHLLDYDQVMNEQREIIYGERNRVLRGEDLKDHIMNMLKSVIERTVNKYTEGEDKSHWDINAANEQLLPIFKKPLIEAEIDDKEALIEKLYNEAVRIYEKKETEIGSEQMREVERVILLRVIDQKWTDHIDDIDQMRQGITLRAYAQRDPLLEYKFVSFDMFEEMSNNIQLDTVRGLFNVRIAVQPEREQVAKETFTNKDESAKSAPKKRATQKVGRNDPCPCGSGKKYKHCCGKNL